MVITPEDNPLRVKTCSVTQINNKDVVLTAEFVLLVVLMHQDVNNKNTVQLHIFSPEQTN
jgi:hypothetical protein